MSEVDSACDGDVIVVWSSYLMSSSPRAVKAQLKNLGRPLLVLTNVTLTLT